MNSLGHVCTGKNGKMNPPPANCDEHIDGIDLKWSAFYDFSVHQGRDDSWSEPTPSTPPNKKANPQPPVAHGCQGCHSTNPQDPQAEFLMQLRQDTASATSSTVTVQAENVNLKANRPQSMANAKDCSHIDSVIAAWRLSGLSKSHCSLSGLSWSWFEVPKHAAYSVHAKPRNSKLTLDKFNLKVKLRKLQSSTSSKSVCLIVECPKMSKAMVWKLLGGSAARMHHRCVAWIPDASETLNRLSTVKHRSLGPWGRWYADDFKNQVHPWFLLWLDQLSTKCFLEAKAGFQNETHRLLKFWGSLRTLCLRPCCRQRWCHCCNFAILSMWCHWRHWCHHNFIFLIYINLVQALGNIRHVHSFRIAFGCIWFKWRNLPKSHQWLAQWGKFDESLSLWNPPYRSLCSCMGCLFLQVDKYGQIWTASKSQPMGQPRTKITKAYCGSVVNLWWSYDDL